MSTERWNHNGVHVSSYAGPNSPDWPNRNRMQVTVGTRFISMTMKEWQSLVLFTRLAGDEPLAYEWHEREYDSGLVRDGIMVCIELRDAKGNNVLGD